MRARMALGVAGIACELREVLLRDKPMEMLALSQKGTVPVLHLSDGRVIDESLDLEKHALWWTGRSLEPSELDLFYEMLIGKGCSDNEKKI